MKPTRITRNSGNAEWITPPEILQAAHAVMGGIDVDPASMPEAQGFVKASKYYTALDDGLAQQWEGRVWLNPPYAQPLIQKFIVKLGQEYDQYRIAQAMVLVNNATETKWAQELFRRSQAVCFFQRRLQFYRPDGAKAKQPLQGQVLFYITRDTWRLTQFEYWFGKHGAVMTKRMKEREITGNV
jgi:phage N-6-adenine-methyltransferase